MSVREPKPSFREQYAAIVGRSVMERIAVMRAELDAQFGVPTYTLLDFIVGDANRAQADGTP